MNTVLASSEQNPLQNSAMVSARSLPRIWYLPCRMPVSQHIQTTPCQHRMLPDSPAAPTPAGRKTHIRRPGKVEENARHGEHVGEGNPSGTRCPAEVFVSLHVHVWSCVSDGPEPYMHHSRVSLLRAAFSWNRWEGRTGVLDQSRVHTKGWECWSVIALNGQAWRWVAYCWRDPPSC